MLNVKRERSSQMRLDYHGLPNVFAVRVLSTSPTPPRAEIRVVTRQTRQAALSVVNSSVINRASAIDKSVKRSSIAVNRPPPHA